MDEEKLERLVEDRLTIRQIAVELETSFTNVRYWLKKYGLKTYNGPHGKKPVNYTRNRRCGTCGETDPEKFYGDKANACASCHNDYTIKKGREKRLKAIALLGGKCTHCGFDLYSGALDFHHVDASTKDVAFSSWRNWSWKRIAVELEKCILLCKNCHAMEHHRLRLLGSLEHSDPNHF